MAADMAAHLRAQTQMAYNNLVNDLDALDEDKAGGAAGGLRPAIKIVAECGAVNGTLAHLVATGELSRASPAEREAFYAAITTRAEARAVLDDGTQKLYAAIDGASPERWADAVPGRFGPWSRSEAAGYAALHMMYHDGQLNAIHLGHGDTEMHWK